MDWLTQTRQASLKKVRSLVKRITFFLKICLTFSVYLNCLNFVLIGFKIVFSVRCFCVAS